MSEREQADKVVVEIAHINDVNLLVAIHNALVVRIKQRRAVENMSSRIGFAVDMPVRIKADSRKAVSAGIAGVVGKIKKLNITKAVVDFNGVSWVIPFGLLEQAKS